MEFANQHFRFVYKFVTAHFIHLLTKSNSMSVLLHYAKGTIRKAKKIMGAEADLIPYMKFKEIDWFSEVLQKLKPRRVLEYGCGYSSLYYPSFLDAQATWTSVEHDEAWSKGIKDKLTDSRVQINHVPADGKEWHKEGTLKEFPTYVNTPKKMEKFDLILIDGMAREACIDLSPQLLNPKGVVVVHDCNRTKYHPHIHQFKHWAIWEDFRRTSGGIGIASNYVEIGKILDIEKHKKVWKTDTAVNNFFKLKFLLLKKGKPFRFTSSK